MGTPGVDKIKLINEKGEKKKGLMIMYERHQDLR